MSRIAVNQLVSTDGLRHATVSYDPSEPLLNYIVDRVTEGKLHSIVSVHDPVRANAIAEIYVLTHEELEEKYKKGE
jgi:hypothetical protein